MSPPYNLTKGVVGRTQRKRWREGAQPNSGAVAAAIRGTATVEVVAPGVVAARLGETGKMVRVVATTTAAEVATVVEAREERRVLAVAQSAAKGATRPEPTGAAAAAREEAPEDGGTAHEGLQRGTARQPLPARLRARTRTAAR